MKHRVVLIALALVLQTLAPSVLSSPRYVIYYNSVATPLNALVGTPYTHVILSFVRPVIEADGSVGLIHPPKLQPWPDLSELKKDGKKVMISFGGGLSGNADYVPIIGHEAELATSLASFVRKYQLDGVDIDFEVSESFHTERPAGVIDGRQFLIRLTEALRQHLPAPRYLISHAPQPPYLDKSWHGGPYLDVIAKVGQDIDWLAVQYYDNPGFDLPTDSHVVGAGKTPFVTSYISLVEHPSGPNWPSTKLLVGKPVYKADAANGHIAPTDVIEHIITPLKKRYGDAFGGLMGWQFSDLTADHRAWNSEVGSALLEPSQ
ncbi:MAG: hypothetical protein DHS20C11_04900 [Lysobacteraceae bacterium]|nr:MAG: hypothetical protein DHS20C11_04900 [Xanthomonadaceae bacterium]